MPGKKAVGRPRGSKIKGRKVAPKYRNPKNRVETWAGRGAMLMSVLATELRAGRPYRLTFASLCERSVDLRLAASTGKKSPECDFLATAMRPTSTIGCLPMATPRHSDPSPLVSAVPDADTPQRSV